MNPSLEIFRPGTHAPLGGGTIDFAESDLRAAAEGYDPALFEAPLVVGHPKLDAPAYGWVRSLDFADGKLVAEPDQVDPAFAEMVNAGRFKKISPSFFTPNARNNPTPGRYYLRHVGFLGAAAPSVHGLKPVSFAAEEEGVVTVEFAYSDGWTLGTIGRLFRGLREALIARFGQEAADQALPSFEIESLAEAAGAARAESVAAIAGPSFADPGTTREDDVSKEQELAAREAALNERQAELDRQAAEFAAREAERHRGEIATFVDGLVAAGKVLPGERAALVAFAASLDPAEVIEFAEGEETVKRPSLDTFKTFLSGLPARVDFAERSPETGSEAIDFADADAIGEAAEAYRKKVREETGDEISIAAAVQHVMKRKGS